MEIKCNAFFGFMLDLCKLFPQASLNSQRTQPILFIPLCSCLELHHIARLITSWCKMLLMRLHSKVKKSACIPQKSTKSQLRPVGQPHFQPFQLICCSSIVDFGNAWKTVSKVSGMTSDLLGAASNVIFSTNYASVLLCWDSFTKDRQQSLINRIPALCIAK